MSMKERIIITGATSFIGLALTDLLLGEGYPVTAVIRPGSMGKGLLPRSDNLQVIESELGGVDGLELPGPCRTLFHIGWSSDYPNSRYNLEGQLLNVDYTRRAVELAHSAGCGTFLCVGSQAECGRVEGMITADTPANPENAYAEAKCRTYEMSRELCERYGIKQCWPRLLSAYGPYDRPHTFIMSCIRAGLDTASMEMTPCGQIWDYIYVGDVARALFMVAEKGGHGVRYPIGSGTGRPLREYVKAIAETTGHPGLLDGIGKKPYGDRQVMNLVADISRLTADTGFAPATPFEDGLSRTIASLR